jgi:hypothetical protein
MAYPPSLPLTLSYSIYIIFIEITEAGRSARLPPLPIHMDGWKKCKLISTSCQVRWGCDTPGSTTAASRGTPHDLATCLFRQFARRNHERLAFVFHHIYLGKKVCRLVVVRVAV